MNTHVDLQHPTHQSRASTVSTADRRAADRPRRTPSWHVPERRTGFDRRRPSILTALRDSRPLLVVLLALVGVLSLFDLAATAVGLSLGQVAEANPVMRAAFERGLWSAVALKAASMVLFTLGVWHWRRYRHVLRLALAVAAIYGLVTLYHLVGLTGWLA